MRPSSSICGLVSPPQVLLQKVTGRCQEGEQAAETAHAEALLETQRQQILQQAEANHKQVLSSRTKELEDHYNSQIQKDALGAATQNAALAESSRKAAEYAINHLSSNKQFLDHIQSVVNQLRSNFGFAADEFRLQRTQLNEMRSQVNDQVTALTALTQNVATLNANLTQLSADLQSQGARVEALQRHDVVNQVIQHQDQLVTHHESLTSLTQAVDHIKTSMLKDSTMHEQSKDSPSRNKMPASVDLASLQKSFQQANAALHKNQVTLHQELRQALAKITKVSDQIPQLQDQIGQSAVETAHDLQQDMQHLRDSFSKQLKKTRRSCIGRKTYKN